MISDPKNLEFVLKNESITKGDLFKTRSWDLFGRLIDDSLPLHPLTHIAIGHGIINADGDLWKAQRKAGLKFFSGPNLDALIEDVLPEIYMQTKAELLQHAQHGTELDLQKVFLDLTTRVMGVMAYDVCAFYHGNLLWLTAHW